MNAITYKVPPNQFGIFAYHTSDNHPISDVELTSIINGPITAMQSKLTEELAKVEYENEINNF